MWYDGSTSSIKYGPVDRPALEDLQAEFALRRASPQIWLPMSEMVNLASATVRTEKFDSDVLVMKPADQVM